MAANEKQTPDDEEVVYWIDGVRWTLMEMVNDLKFVEKRELRQFVRESTGDENAEWFHAQDDMDVLPAFVYLIRRRSNKDYTYAEALELKPKDLEVPKEEKKGPGPTVVGEPPKSEPASNGQSGTTGIPGSLPTSASAPGI